MSYDGSNYKGELYSYRKIPDKFRSNINIELLKRVGAPQKSSRNWPTTSAKIYKQYQSKSSRSLLQAYAIIIVDWDLNHKYDDNIYIKNWNHQRMSHKINEESKSRLPMCIAILQICINSMFKTNAVSISFISLHLLKNCFRYSVLQSL